MDHAITIGDFVVVGAVVGGAICILGLIVFVIYVMNPFRTGH